MDRYSILIYICLHIKEAMDILPTQQSAPAPKKKPYIKPELTVYGEVRVLTQAQTTGSMESSGGTGVQMSSCERRLKQRIARVGEHPLGVGLYLFDYRPEFQAAYGCGRQFGVMVDEVEALMPGAVHLNALGHKTVNLTMLGISRPMH